MLLLGNSGAHRLQRGRSPPIYLLIG